MQKREDKTTGGMTKRSQFRCNAEASKCESDLRPPLSLMNKTLSDTHRLNFVRMLRFEFRHCHSESFTQKILT